MRLARIVAPMALVALIGVACSSGNGTTSGATTPTQVTTTPAQTPSETPSETATTGGSALTLVDNMFQPADFTIAAGTEITIENMGSALHNFSVEGQSIDKDINPGETETESLELPPGTYTMFCKYHRSIGMEGTLTISG